MNRREQLIDNYEDALFAVLMDKVAQDEGAKLREENQRLREDPAAEVPEHVDAVARKTIRKAFVGQNRRSALHVAKRVLNTVALIVLISSAIFATAYAAFPDMRVKTLNLLIQSSDVASRLSLVQEGSASGHENTEEIMLCGYSLPKLDGFSVLDQSEDRHGGWIKYKNNEKDATIRISISDAKTAYVDTENVNIEEISIQGFSGVMITKGNHITISWSEPEHKNHILVDCMNLSQSFAVGVADQIVRMNNR